MSAARPATAMLGVVLMMVSTYACGAGGDDRIAFRQFTITIPRDLMECGGVYNAASENGRTDVTLRLFAGSDTVSLCSGPGSSEVVVRIIEAETPVHPLGPLPAPTALAHAVRREEFSAETVAVYRLTPLLDGKLIGKERATAVVGQTQLGCMVAFEHRGTVVQLLIKKEACSLTSQRIARAVLNELRTWQDGEERTSRRSA